MKINKEEEKREKLHQGKNNFREKPKKRKGEFEGQMIDTENWMDDKEINADKTR
jgi:hypothetical protein